MNNIIKHLDNTTINLIAAGEVVESPYSVVKELIENSIDANSKNIVLEIKDGGKTYIRVTDDGDGIEEKYILTAFERHTTSKIRSYEDFCFVRTNGFRGEALASISAVSQITLTTKTKESFYGNYIKMDSKNVIEQSKVGANNGSTIIIENLLYNVPARKSFLKSNQAETAKISQIITKFALINNDIKFKYINNDKVIFTSFGNSSIEDALNLLYSNQYKGNLIQLSESINEGLKLNGILGNNSIMESTRRNQHLFINNRVIISRFLTECIESAYRAFIPSGKFPVYIINIDIDPGLIDINVHPNKLDVKFSDKVDISYFIKKAVTKVLSDSIMIPNASLNQKKFTNQKDIDFIQQKMNTDLINNDHFLSNRNSNKFNISNSKNCNDNEKYSDNKKLDNYLENKLSSIENQKKDSFQINETENKDIYNRRKQIEEREIITDESQIKEFNYSNLEYIGIFINSYIIFQMDYDMYLMDQHAAHERILYEKYLKQFENHNIAVQHMIVPFIINLPIELIENIQQILDKLNQFGIEGDIFSEKSIAIRSIPDIFTESQTRAFIDETFNVFINTSDYAVHIQNMIASKACKAAIKANSPILNMEVEYILKELDLCTNKYTCPHGRPITVKLTKYDLEKMFKRVL